MSKCGSGKTCRPTVQCSAQIPDTKNLKNSMCQMEDGSTGTCCKDVPKSWVRKLSLFVFYQKLIFVNLFLIYLPFLGTHGRQSCSKWGNSC